MLLLLQHCKQQLLAGPACHSTARCFFTKTAVNMCRCHHHQEALQLLLLLTMPLNQRYHTSLQRHRMIKQLCLPAALSLCLQLGGMPELAANVAGGQVFLC